MTALEEYTAHHAETVEDIMHVWPWRRFEGMFRRHLLRQAREHMREMRDRRLAAMDANMNWDSKENASAREQRTSGIQDAYEEAVRLLYSPPRSEETADEMDDPLFAPLARRRAQQATQPLVAEAGMGRQLIEAVDE
jgi:hypothetical protein